jgi:Protein of unknown function (DUF3303)
MIQMKYVVSMTYLRNGSAAENKAAQRELLNLYANWKPAAGTTITEFLGRCDGRGAVSIVETDNPAELIDSAAKFGAFIQYEILPVVEIADAVKAAQEAEAFLEASNA